MNPKIKTRISKRDMKQDQFVSSVFYLSEQFQKHQRVIYGVIAGIVVVVVLIVLLINNQKAAHQEVVELFGRASVEARSGNTSLAIIDFRKIVDEHGGSDLAGLACFNLAKANFRQREFNEAETFFQRYLDKYGDNKELVLSAMAGIAGCMEQRGEFAQASDQYLAAAKRDFQHFMATDLLFSAIRTAVEIPDSTRALRAYELMREELGEDAQMLNPAKMYLYEHKILEPPLE